jgi:hypothetical protein
MTSIVTPLVYKQKKYDHYGVCSDTGKIFSSKTGRWRALATKVSGKSPYPQTRIKHRFCTKAKTISVHVAVQETLNPNTPQLPDVSEHDWNQTPVSVKMQCRELWQVNHIDHNPRNFHPGNLEWSTAKQNVQSYLQFRKRYMISGSTQGCGQSIIKRQQEDPLYLFFEFD